MAKNRRARRRELMKRKGSASVSGHPKPSPFTASRALSRKALRDAEAAKEKADREEEQARARVTIDRAIRWFIIQTFPGHEERVERRLLADEEKGRPAVCVVYRPREVVQRGRRGKVLTTFRHVMPRHLFIGVRSHEDPHVLMRDIQGFHEVLRINGRDVRIGASDLQRFADVVTDQSERLRGIGDTLLRENDDVRITRGTYAQFKGEVIELTEGGTVLVRIQMFGSPVDVRQPLDHLIAA